MKPIISEIMPGVNLRVLQTDRFKTCCMSFYFLQKLSDNASKNALIPRVLRRGSAEHPDMEAISAALDELYGARIEPNVRKFGDVSASGFLCDFIDGANTDAGDKQLEKCVGLLSEILLNPVLESGTFTENYVTGERENLADEIRALINEKLSYSYRRANTILFEDSEYGLSELGTIESLDVITPDSLYKHYKSLLSHAPIEIFFCGNYSFEKVKTMILSAFSSLTKSKRDKISLSEPKYTKPKTEITEHLDMAQAVMLLGMKTDIPHDSPMSPALQLLSAVLGGGTASKLFLNVRERESLCYFTGTQFDRFAGTIYMYCGIDPKNVSKTKLELMRQFDACVSGDISEDELSNAKRFLIDQLKITDDSPVTLESYWIREAVANSSLTPAATAKLLNETGLDKIVESAKTVKPVITYLLSGKGEISNETRFLPKA